jgi:hypothetical protein
VLSRSDVCPLDACWVTQEKQHRVAHVEYTECDGDMVIVDVLQICGVLVVGHEEGHLRTCISKKQEGRDLNAR